MKKITTLVIWERQLRQEMIALFGESVPNCAKHSFRDNQLPLLSNSSELESALRYVETHSEHPNDVDLYETTEYTSSDLKKTRYFQMIVPLPLELEGIEPDKFGTVYLETCSCTWKDKLKGDIYIDRKFMKKYSIGQLGPNYYVSDQLRKQIEENYFSGISFHGHIIDFKNREMPTYHIANITSVLPKLSDKTWFHDVDPCQKCRRSRCVPRSDLRYNKNDINQWSDFNLTQEYLSMDYRQYLIVSAKVRDFCLQNKVFARFIPIEEV